MNYLLSAVVGSEKPDLKSVQSHLSAAKLTNDNISKEFLNISSYHMASIPKSNLFDPSNNVDDDAKTHLMADYSISGVPMSFSNVDGRTAHNSIASKLLGEREKLMQLFMAKREEDYISRKPFKLFAGTWNVNGQTPPKSVSDWLAADPDPPDMYVIGFQELDLSKEAFLFSESLKEEEWRLVVNNSLHLQGDYKLVKLIRLVGIMLLVYITKKHVSAVTQVDAHYVGTGLLGRMGNKGGVAVRLNFYSSTICVVNSHLAAHTELVQRRNEDFKDICSRMLFHDPDGQGHFGILQHDIVVWLGDLNYRIDGLTHDVVKNCIDKKQFKLLKENDQLLCEKGKGNAFKEFEEGDITFRPTYKYNPGTDEWDSSEKYRIPAWCDRILWREILPHLQEQNKKQSKSVRLISYRSHEALKISDHKPVSSLFDINIKVVNHDDYRLVYEEEIRRMDKMENDWLPTVTLDTHTIDFGEVRFQTPVERFLEIHNTGQLPCQFEFIAKFKEPNYCQPWLTISKPRGYIMPDEKELINLEVYVNRLTVADLNIGKKKLEDILILHLVGGKDFFLSLNGCYLPSCFGMPLEVLCAMKNPVREVAQSEILTFSQNYNSLNLMKVPKELWRILDHLFHKALKQEDLFQQPGLHSEVQAIQEELDCHLPTTVGINHLPGSNHSVVEALLVFLESLPNPVIPFTYYHQCLPISNNFMDAKKLVNSLPSSHRCLFFYLIAFIQELLKYRKYNGLTVNYIGNIFAGLILRPSKRKSGIEARNEKQQAYNFIEMFLKNRIDDC